MGGLYWLNTKELTGRWPILTVVVDQVCCQQQILSAKADQDNDEALPHCQDESRLGICGSEGCWCGFGAANLGLVGAEF